MNAQPVLRVVRVFLASPGDVQPERDALDQVVKELNKTTAKELGLVIDLFRWEIDVNPGFHIDGAQGLVDSTTQIEDCDLLIGIFWKRFGTPTKDAKSGTEHEFRKAYEAWKRNKRPDLMIYFKQKEFWPQTDEEEDQLRLVRNFKRSFPQEGLYKTFREKSRFVDLVRTHLTRFLFKFDETSNNSNIIANAPPIEDQISRWIQSRASSSTIEAYQAHMTKFRTVLHEQGLDLDSEDVRAIASIIQSWANKAERKTPIKSGTYNHRLSSISSFFRFAIDQGWMKVNPATLAKRRDENDSDAAKPIEEVKVKHYLKLINRKTLEGKRDYALLCILFTTGARASEITGLRYRDIAIKESTVTITTRKKGGEPGEYSLKKKSTRTRFLSHRTR